MLNSWFEQKFKNLFFVSEEGTYGEAPLSARDVVKEKKDYIEQVRKSMKGRIQTKPNGK